MNDLCIGGGGYAGIIFIGVLEYIHENNLLDLKNLYGCSIGSLIGVLYTAGYKPKEILYIFMNMNMNDMLNYNINNIHEKYLINISFLESLMSPLWDKYSEDITIKEFSVKTNVEINIFVTNINNNSYENLSNKNTPNVKLKDAIKASMSIPFIFKPVDIGDNKYIDGCCKNRLGIPIDKYILGYTIVLNMYKNTPDIVQSIITSIIDYREPQSTFIINCIHDVDYSFFINLKNFNTKFIVKLYSEGIQTAKDQLN